ncbi:MAG: putative toxin-antitoxin system toxin component, PIN family [Anaerolineaceae bacterium]|nr:putative toxin-antitoxin system toxin component, PIN family [Anaerolineaceae bacterium]
MRVVLDANIFISALISSQGNPAKILEKWQKRELEIVVSPTIVAEIERVTGYERLQKKYRRIREEREGLIDDLRNFATMVDPQQNLSVVQADDSDNRYIECAIESGASYIVTGDPHLLDINDFQGIPILTPAVFVALLENT